MEDFLIILKHSHLKREIILEEVKNYGNWHIDQIEDVKLEYSKFINSYPLRDKSIADFEIIDWKSILAVFNVCFYRLWNTFEIPKHMEESYSQKENFRSRVYFTIKHRLYIEISSIVYKNLKINLSNDEINKEIYQVISILIDQLLGTFQFQYTLTNIKVGENPKIIANRVNKIYKDAEQGKKFPKGRSFKRDEEVVFKRILESYMRQTNNIYCDSFKAIAYRLGEQELNYKDKYDINPKTEEYNKKTQIELFYERFLRWKKKNS